MTKKMLPIVFVVLFVFGWFCSSAYSQVSEHISISQGNQIEIAGSESNGFIDKYFSGNKEQISPFDWIEENEIHVYEDKVVIDVSNPQWAKFTDTNSMDPIIDEGSHAIEIVPESEDDVHVGDIVSYKSNYVDGTVIHRVIEVGDDNDGWYARTKGDNNAFEDPGKIRFSQVKRILVAIIY